MTLNEAGNGRWPLVRLKDVTLDVRNWDPSTEPDAEFTYVDISAIDNSKAAIVAPKQLRGSEAPSRARRPVRDGDVLFSNVRTYLRNVALVSNLKQPAVASTGFTLLRPDASKLSSRYLFHLARSDFFISQITPQQTGTQYPATSDRVVRSHAVPLPPLREQEEIARLLDDVESARTSALTHIRSSRRGMDRLWREVLTRACSGELTDDWAGHEPFSSWNKVTLRDLVVHTLGGDWGKGADETEPDYQPAAVIRGTDFRVWNGKRANLAAVRYLKPSSLARRRLETGDLVVEVSGGGPNQPVGRVLLIDAAALASNVRPLVCSNFCRQVRLNADVNPKFVYFALRWEYQRGTFYSLETQTTNLHNLDFDAFLDLALTLPTLNEQAEIVRRAEALFDAAGRVEGRLLLAEGHADCLAQSALSKAFRGDLLLNGSNGGTELLGSEVRQTPSREPRRSRGQA